MAWDYKRNSDRFPVLPEGDYRIRISKAEKRVSKKGRDMIAFEFDVSGRKEVLFHYITFLEDYPEITNRQLTQFFDSFKDINEGDFNTQNWVGKVGACRVKHEEYNGEPSAKVSYFIKAEKQGGLPPWSEPKKGPTYAGDDIPTDQFVPVPDDISLPLF